MFSANALRGHNVQKSLVEQGDGAKAVRVPESDEFSTKLNAPLVDALRKGGKQLNSLQMRKLKDATALLQSMQTHKLQPLCLYTASELFEVMASIAETWKNSGKSCLEEADKQDQGKCTRTQAT